MSYALRLAADARRAHAALPFGAQEEVLDLLERIAGEADSGATDVTQIHHLVYRSGREAVYVRVYCTVMHDIRTVTLDRLVAVVVGEDE